MQLLIMLIIFVLTNVGYAQNQNSTDAQELKNQHRMNMPRKEPVSDSELNCFYHQISASVIALSRDAGRNKEQTQQYTQSRDPIIKKEPKKYQEILNIVYSNPKHNPSYLSNYIQYRCMLISAKIGTTENIKKLAILANKCISTKLKSESHCFKLSYNEIGDN